MHELKKKPTILCLAKKSIYLVHKNNIFPNFFKSRNFYWNNLNTIYLSRWRNGIAQTVIRAHGAQGFTASSIAESGRNAGRRRRRWISRSLQRRAVYLVHTYSQKKRYISIWLLEYRQVSPVTFIYRMYRVRSTSRHSVISYDVGYLVCSTYAVECVKCGRLKSARWSYDCAST